MTVDCSQRIYINIKLEERLDHRLIVADADLMELGALDIVYVADGNAREKNFLQGRNGRI